MTAQPPSYKTLASLSRMNLLYQLQQRGTMSVGDLAEAAGLHPNTAREHLDRLISEGFVTCTPEPRETKGRPRMLYSAASGNDSNADSVRAKKIEAALIRAEQLRRMQQSPIVAQATQRQFDALDDHLDQAGFDARISGDQLTVSLHDCPYSEMVREHPEVCGVHFRLIQDVLEQAEGPLRARQLRLIDAPRLCTIDLHHLAPLPNTDALPTPGTDLADTGLADTDPATDDPAAADSADADPADTDPADTDPAATADSAERPRQQVRRR